MGIILGFMAVVFVSMEIIKHFLRKRMGVGNEVGK
jgi:hypothetical protein